MIKAEIIADSKNEFGNRITTMIVTFPRIILAEFNTHRMFSRNSASSRAIPFEKMVKSVEENPFIPIAWQKDHKGMQGVEYITDETDIQLNCNAWLKAKEAAITWAKYLNHGVVEGRNNGVTKQICNRLLEPFMYHTVIVTATEWENFFALRCPKYYHYVGKNSELRYRSRKDALNHWELMKDTLVGYEKIKDWSEVDWLKMNEGQADIHMMALAESMWDAYNESIPKQLKAGEWHIPFGDNIAMSILDQREFIDKAKSLDDLKIKIATARCARISYTVVGEEGKSDNYANDIKLHDRLATSGHMSPFEHCAKTMNEDEYVKSVHTIPSYDSQGFFEERGWSGNFRGFIQYRKMFVNENITK